MVVKNRIISKFPDECKCMWCGETMKRGGSDCVVSGVNHFAFWCDNCGSVVIHAKAFGEKITGFSMKFETEKMGENK